MFLLQLKDERVSIPLLKFKKGEHWLHCTEHYALTHRPRGHTMIRIPNPVPGLWEYWQNKGKDSYWLILKISFENDGEIIGMAEDRLLWLASSHNQWNSWQIKLKEVQLVVMDPPQVEDDLSADQADIVTEASSG